MKTKNIIVRMPNWLGDFIMALPALETVRKSFPSSKITVMCLKHHAFFLKNNKNADFVFSFKKAKFFSEEPKLLINQIKEKRFDLGILFTNSFSSAYLFWKAKVKKRVGYSMHLRRLFLTKPIKFSKEKKHLVESYKDIIFKGLDIDNNKDIALPEIVVEDTEKKRIKKLLRENGYIEGKKIVGINSFAAYGSAKCWPLESFKKVAEKLLEDENIFVVFTGDEKAWPYIDEVVDGLSFRVINLAGKTTLSGLCALIDLCDCFLTNDSGPMHLAVALRTPLVAIFGSTCSDTTGPYKTGVVIRKKTDCSPCFKRVCDRDFSCMKNIVPDEVYLKVIEVLYAEKNNKKY